MLTFTLVGPTIGATLERMRRRAETTTTAMADALQERQADWRERLDELGQENRERVAQQVEYLLAQAREMQRQSRQLQKALRAEARQRRKLLVRASKAGVDWSQEVLKRGEQLTGEVIERGGKVSRDLVERGQELSQDLTKRGRRLSRDLAKRSRKVTRNMAKRGEALLQPERKHSRIWTFVGFGVGLALAGAITYRLVRGRVARQLAENESFEIPTAASMNGVPADSAEQAGTGDQQLEEVELVFFTTEEEAGPQE